MSPLVPIGIGAAVLAYLALSSKTASAATSPLGGGAVPPSPSGGGGGGYGGLPSSGDQGTILGPGGSSTPLGPSEQGQGVNQGFDPFYPGGPFGPPGLGGLADGSGGNSGVPTDPSAFGGAAGMSGTAAGIMAPNGWPVSVYRVGQNERHVGQGVHEWHFSQHPNVLAVTGGRGGWVPNYDGCHEGYAPPAGLPIH